MLRNHLACPKCASGNIGGTKNGLTKANIPLYQRLIENQIPIIFINTYYPELEVPHISLDDQQAAELAVNYLIEKGHSNIGTIL